LAASLKILCALVAGLPCLSVAIEIFELALLCWSSRTLRTLRG